MKTLVDNRKKSFGYRFAMLHRLQMAMCRKDILGQGLQAGQLPFVISLVHEEKPVTQDYLSACLAIDKGTTARALRQLEKNGFVTRITNPENRRQNLVSAKQKAYDAMEKLVPVLDHAMNAFVRGFSEDDSLRVQELLDRMLANAQEAVNTYHWSRVSDV